MASCQMTSICERSKRQVPEQQELARIARQVLRRSWGASACAHCLTRSAQPRAGPARPVEKGELGFPWCACTFRSGDGFYDKCPRLSRANWLDRLGAVEVPG